MSTRNAAKSRNLNWDTTIPSNASECGSEIGNGILMSGCIPCDNENIILECISNEYVSLTIESATPGTTTCLLCPLVVLCCPFVTTLTDSAYHFVFYKDTNLNIISCRLRTKTLWKESIVNIQRVIKCHLVTSPEAVNTYSLNIQYYNGFMNKTYDLKLNISMHIMQDFYDKIQLFVKKVNILIKSLSSRDNLVILRLFMCGDAEEIVAAEKDDEMRSAEVVNKNSKVLPVSLSTFQNSIPNNKNIRIKTTQVAVHNTHVLPPDMKGCISNHTFRSMRCKKWKLMVVLSSTGTDTQVERKILTENIFPDLMQYGFVHGLQDVTVIDLSTSPTLAVADAADGGGNETNHSWNTWVVDHQLEWTNRLCMLQQARNESSGLFFISLQSMKYGPGVLPRTIPASTFERWLHDILNEDMGMLESCEIAKAWYRLDENAIPPEYVLESLSEHTRKEYADVVLPTLFHLFDNMPCSLGNNEEESVLYVGRSLIDWESRIATQRDAAGSNRQRCSWMRRQFVQAITRSHDEENNYSDAHDSHTRSRLNELIEYLSRSVKGRGSKEVFRIDISTLISREGAKFDKYCADYDDVVRSALSAEVASILERQYTWKRDGNGLGVPGDVIDRITYHYYHSRRLCAGFVGRGQMIADFLEYIKNPRTKDPSGQFSGVSCVIVGNPGSGKSAMMAKLAESMFENAMKLALDSIADSGSSSEEHNTTTSPKLSSIAKTNPKSIPNSNAHAIPIPIIVRFCGKRTGICTALELMTSVCQEIACHGGVGTEHVQQQLKSIPLSYPALVKYFHDLLAFHPMILFIDGVDELSNAFEARNHLTFLQHIQPHPHTRIILSAVTLKSCEEWEAEPKYKEKPCDDAASAHCIRINLVDVIFLPFYESFDKQLILALSKRHRKLTPLQLESVTRYTPEPSALYMTLLLHVVSKWTSCTTLHDDDRLPTTVHELFDEILNTLEKQHGPALVRTALSLITFSVYGVSDFEMEDLLSMVDTVVLEVNTGQIGQKEKAGPRVPRGVWIRLLDSISDLWVTSPNGGHQWSHEQLQEAAAKRLQPEKQQSHKLLATYFGNKVGYTKQNFAFVRQQPITLNETRTWDCNAILNKRRFEEASFHMVTCGMYEEALEELCSLELLCGVLKCGATLSLTMLTSLQELNRIVVNGVLGEVNTVRVQQYTLWLETYMPLLCSLENPVDSIVALGTAQPVTSKVYADCRQLVKEFSTAHSGVEYSSDGNSLNPVMLSSNSWFRGVVLGPDASYTDLKQIIPVHDGGITGIKLSVDGTILVSCSLDCRICVLNIKSGVVVNRIEKHSKPIRCIDLTRDKQYICTGSEDKTARVWRVDTGVEVSTMTHGGAVGSVRFSRDGRRVVTGCVDRTVRVWYKETGDLIKFYRGDSVTDVLVSVSFSPDDSQILSGCADGRLLVWENGTIPVMTLQHGEKLSCCCYNPNSRCIASAGSSSASGANAVAANSQAQEGAKKREGLNCGYINIWSTDLSKHPQPLVMCEAHKGLIEAICFTSNGKYLVSGGRDKWIRVWLVALNGHSNASTSDATMELFQSYQSSEWIRSLSIFKGGCFIASGCNKGYVKLWNIDYELPAKERNKLTYRSGHTAPVRIVRYSPDGHQILSAGDDGCFKVWNSMTLELVHTVVLPALDPGNVEKTNDLTNTNAVTSLCYRPDGLIVACGCKDKIVRLYNTTNWTEVEIEQPTQYQKTHGSGGVTINCPGTGTGAGAKLGALSHTMQYSPDGMLLACSRFEESKQPSITLWKHDTLKRKNVLFSNQVHSVLWLNFSWDAKFLVVTYRDKASKNAVATKNSREVNKSDKEKETHTQIFHVEHLAIIMRGAGLGVGTFRPQAYEVLFNNTSCEIDGKTKLNIAGTELDSSSVSSSIVPTTGTSAKRKVNTEAKLVLRTMKFQIVQTYSGYSGTLNTVCFNSDGNTIVGGSKNGYVYLWNTSSGSLIKTLLGHTSSILSVCMNPNPALYKNQFVTCGEDYNVRVWDFYAHSSTRNDSDTNGNRNK